MPDLPLAYALAMQALSPSARASRIWMETGMSPTRFFQRVNAMIDDGSACQQEPVPCLRLRRLRESRQAAQGRG